MFKKEIKADLMDAINLAGRLYRCGLHISRVATKRVTHRIPKKKVTFYLSAPCLVAWYASSWDKCCFGLTKRVLQEVMVKKIITHCYDT